jgi:hypothetical protein
MAGQTRRHTAIVGHDLTAAAGHPRPGGLDHCCGRRMLRAALRGAISTAIMTLAAPKCLDHDVNFMINARDGGGCWVW